jgi:hypothetical protein
MKAKAQLRRSAIDAFKQAFIDGTPFTVVEAQRFLSSMGFFGWHIGKRHVADWLRQARYELADDHISVTNPAVKLKYVSNPNAPASERIVVRDQLITDLQTRATNIRRLIESDAHQVDTSPKEIERHVRLKVATELLAAMA